MLVLPELDTPVQQDDLSRRTGRRVHGAYPVKAPVRGLAVRGLGAEPAGDVEAEGLTGRHAAQVRFERGEPMGASALSRLDRMSLKIIADMTSAAVPRGLSRISLRRRSAWSPAR